MNINIFLGDWVDALADIQISHESSPCSALQVSTLYKLFESKVVLNVRGTWYFLRGTWYFAQNRMLVVMAGSGEAQKPYF